MGAVERFEDLIAWQKARRLTQDVYSLTLQGMVSRDRQFCDQIRGSSVSIMSNIAEGFGRHNAAEFVQYLRIARGSCAETKSLVYVAFDAGYIKPDAFDHLLTEVDELSKIIAALRERTMQRSTPRPPVSTAQGSAAKL